MRKLSQRGLPVQVQEPPPLSPQAERAAHCWRFMGRQFAAAALPVYLSLYPVDDVEAMVELLLALSDAAAGGAATEAA